MPRLTPVDTTVALIMPIRLGILDLVFAVARDVPIKRKQTAEPGEPAADGRGRGVSWIHASALGEN